MASAVLACEVTIRSFEPYLSKDIEHIRRIPSIVTTLEHAKGVRVLFLGNSLTRSGVDNDTIVAELVENGSLPVHAERIYPDDTTLAEWYYLWAQHLDATIRRADVVVVGFARNQLADSAPLHPDRIAGYGGAAGIGAAFRNDVREPGDRMTYLLACLSHLYLNRERIRSRILDALVPAYRESAQTFNRAQSSMKTSARGRQGLSYARLSRFLQLTTRAGTRTVFVAMPVANPYTLDEALRQAVEKSGGVLLDLRHIHGLSADHFLDGLHLSPTGARIYTKALAARLTHDQHIFELFANAAQQRSIGRDGHEHFNR